MAWIDDLYSRVGDLNDALGNKLNKIWDNTGDKADLNPSLPTTNLVAAINAIYTSIPSALSQGPHIDITSNVISVKPTLNTWMQDSGNNDRILMSTVPTGTNHNDFILKQISLDGYFKLRNAQNEDYFVYRNTTEEVMFPLVGVSTGTNVNLVMMGTGGAMWRSNRTIGDLIQTLSIPSGQTGGISISGGNTVNIQNIARLTVTDFDNIANEAKFGISGFYNSTGSLNYPATTGQGILSLRATNGSAQGSFALWKSGGNERNLYVNLGSTGGWQGWEPILTPSNIGSYLPTIPTNYITTDTTQTGLSGDKTTSGIWTFAASYIHINKEAGRTVYGSVGSSSGDVHIGSSGIAAPANGTQDYGFYCAHNAYRDTDGNWKHSRTSSIRSYIFKGGHHQHGFSWGYSVNVGTGNIEWTELMNLSVSGSGGTLNIRGNVATPFRIERTLNNNTNIEYINSGISIFAGSTNGTAWAIGSSANLNDIADRWMWVDSTGRITSQNGFAINGQTDSSIVLAGGGYRPVSDFALAGSLGNYILKSGDTVSGTLNFTTQDAIHYAGVGRIFMNSQYTAIGGNYASTGLAGVMLRPQGSQITTNQVVVRGTGQIDTTNGHGNSSQWYEAYTWGNHALAGYALASSVPAQVNLIQGTGIGISGTYPNLTITNTEPNIVQTLSMSTDSIGTLSISGGNSVNVNGIRLIGKPNADVNPFSTSQNGLFAYSVAGTTSGYPATLGGGIIFNRGNNDVRASFDFFKGQNNSVNELWFRVGSTQTDYFPYEIVASREWVTAQNFLKASNAWTTNTPQTGLSGDKETSGRLTILSTQANKISLLRTSGINSTMAFGVNSVIAHHIGSANGDRFAISGTNGNLSDSNNQYFYADDKGIGTRPLAGSYILGRDQGGFTVDKNTTSSNWSSILRHNFSGVGRTAIIGGINSASAMQYWGMAMWDNAETVNGFPTVFFGFTGNDGNLRASSLAGIGDRMVYANSNGDLLTTAMPVIPAQVNLIQGTGINITGTYPNLTITNTAPNATHTGDVTGATALTIVNNAVTHTKYQNIPTARILGRVTAGTGNVEELTQAQVLTFLGVQAGANNYTHPNHTGDVTSVGDGTTTIVNNAITTNKIANNNVTLAKLQNVPGFTLLGKGTAGSGNVGLVNIGATLSLVANELNAVDDFLDHFISTPGTYNIPIESKKTNVNIAISGTTINVDDGRYDGDELSINGCNEWSAVMQGNLRNICRDQGNFSITRSSLFWWSAAQNLWIQVI